MPSASSIPKSLAGVTHIVAVGSGKGGVGKSTTTVNLASALEGRGLRVGVLDADIYGPSLPQLLGLKAKSRFEDGITLVPLDAYGLKAMSIGFLIPPETAVIWRGPMVQKALRQLLHQVSWAPLDVLLVDLPPGTGDVPLTLAQSVPLSGALIVSTPQDLALADARKSFEMFVKLGVPVLGLVENMSYFLCPHCDKKTDIFDHGGVKKAAEELGVPLLAEIPLHLRIRESSEQGIPLKEHAPQSAEARMYHLIAEKVFESLSFPPPLP